MLYVLSSIKALVDNLTLWECRATARGWRPCPRRTWRPPPPPRRCLRCARTPRGTPPRTPGSGHTRGSSRTADPPPGGSLPQVSGGTQWKVVPGTLLLFSANEEDRPWLCSDLQDSPPDSAPPHTWPGHSLDTRAARTRAPSPATCTCPGPAPAPPPVTPSTLPPASSCLGCLLMVSTSQQNVIKSSVTTFFTVGGAQFTDKSHN